MGGEYVAVGSLALAVVGSLLKVGAVSEKVNAHEKALETKVSKDSLEGFQAEVLRRLERIEKKVDRGVIE